MPDLISHSCAAYAAGRVFGDRDTAGMVVLGTLLPDLLSVVPFKTLGVIKRAVPLPREAFYTVEPFHTPFFVVASCVLLAFFFREQIRARAFLALGAGALIHLFLDLFQYQVVGGDMVLFPFSTRRFQFGVVWADAWPYWILPLVLVALGVELVKKKRENRPEVAHGIQ